MKLSVIICTYNSPRWLEKVLWGYSRQSHADFEIIIADDGSTQETADLVDRMRAHLTVPIQHVWQRDDGFRKCRILNKAILHAGAEYVVFSDGDCIPREDFLAVHARRAERGYYLSGGYHKLPMSTSEAITNDDILSGRCFDYAWLRANGMPRSRKDLKLTAGPRLGRLLNSITITRCNFKGSNGSAWLDDILAVNGFDERMVWGGLDREFGVRLINYGVRSRHVRYDAIVLHLDHGRGYRDPDKAAANKALRRERERDGSYWTDHGISRLRSEGCNGEVRRPHAAGHGHG